MRKTITMVLPALAGLMLLAGVAHADGKATYEAKCKMCHGADAAKLPNIKWTEEAFAAKKDKMGPAKDVAGADLKAALDYAKGLKK